MEKGEVGEQEGTIGVNFHEGNKAKLSFKFCFSTLEHRQSIFSVFLKDLNT